MLHDTPSLSPHALMNAGMKAAVNARIRPSQALLPMLLHVPGISQLALRIVPSAVSNLLVALSTRSCWVVLVPTVSFPSALLLTS